MKNTFLYFLLLNSGLAFAADPPTHWPLPGLGYPPAQKSTIDIDFASVFEQGDLFSEKSTFIWGDYQLLSNRGKRPELTKTIVPMVGLNYERQVFHNLGIRASLSTHWWEEDKALVVSDDEVFTELFEYQYWSGGIGATWHFNLGSRWDPYVGALYSYRYASANCDCSSANKSSFSTDLLIGARFFIGSVFYLSGEFGNHGTGYAKVGLGFKIN